MDSDVVAWRVHYHTGSKCQGSHLGQSWGRWSGRLADKWELKGEVTSEQYERLVAGHDPRTGEQLVQSVKARETVNEFGEKVVTSEHRAGWDATISAPKSVSLAALVGDDERVRDAHRESVNEALKGFEDRKSTRLNSSHSQISYA